MLLRSRLIHIVAAASLAVAWLLLPGCASQARYDSPDQAVASLVAALRANDSEQLGKVFGSEEKQLLSSGDAVADNHARSAFLRAYDTKHHLADGSEGAKILVVGESDWPMPIPIVPEDGKWRFDTKAGSEELLNRRIGRNELCAIQTCLAILDAQREYLSKDRDNDKTCEYATRFFSEPGKKNGLYWPTADNEPPSPLGLLVAEATEEGYRHSSSGTAGPQPYHGYKFRLLTRQGAHACGGAMDYLVKDNLIGGFAVVAWPAEYGKSGIMTFLMNHEGKVYQCDLGENTSKIAASMNDYDPDAQWSSVEQKP